MDQDHESDPLLDELDEVRERIWDSCDRDLDKYFAMLQEGHRELVRQGWKEAPPPPERDKSAA
jgi:hypothetical protein